ncbi:hypothetical protein F5888DRAFT_1608816, partial [Russula emetica]
TSTMHENDPEVLEREKRRNLTRQPYQTSSPLDHSPGWNEHLASTSEAHVKADQDRSSPHDLAARTVAHLKAKVSAEDGPESSTTRFDLDEVSGPLKSAQGTDGVVDIDDTYDEEIKEQEGAWTHKVKREHTEHLKVWHTSFRLSCCSKLIFGFLVSSLLKAPFSPVNRALKTAGLADFFRPPLYF